jgi:Type IV conjugative transfer system lipoprotein (TraV)
LIRIAVTLVVVGVMGFLQACSTADPKPNRDPISVYKDGLEQGSQAMLDEVRNTLKQKSAYGSVEPSYPMRLPPDIRKVWIVEHPNEAGDLIQGHWVFLVVEPGRWASPSVPALHPESETRTPNATPMIEDKPNPTSPGTQNRRNDSQGE